MRYTIIRKYNQIDIKFITKIFNEVVEEESAFLTKNPMTITQMEIRLSKDDLATYVAETDRIVCGSYLLRPNLKGQGNHEANATYFVSEHYRGWGIGYLLEEHSLRTAKKIGFKAMQFNSIVSTNEPSVKLWKKLNF